MVSILFIFWIETILFILSSKNQFAISERNLIRTKRISSSV